MKYLTMVSAEKSADFNKSIIPSSVRLNFHSFNFQFLSVESQEFALYVLMRLEKISYTKTLDVDDCSIYI